MGQECNLKWTWAYRALPGICSKAASLETTFLIGGRNVFNLFFIIVLDSDRGRELFLPQDNKGLWYREVGSLRQNAHSRKRVHALPSASICSQLSQNRPAGRIEGSHSWTYRSSDLRAVTSSLPGQQGNSLPHLYFLLLHWGLLVLCKLTRVHEFTPHFGSCRTISDSSWSGGNSNSFYADAPRQTDRRITFSGFRVLPGWSVVLKLKSCY